MDLKKLGVKELANLQADIQAELQRKQQANRQDVIKQVKALLAENGMSLDDLPARGNSKHAGARAKVAPKYRNPNDEAQTWSGRGRKPIWVVAHLKKGGSMDALAI